MWRTSWLSREVIVLPAFMASVVAYGYAHAQGLNCTGWIALAGVVLCEQFRRFGPKMALSLLSGLSVAELTQAVAQQQAGLEADVVEAGRRQRGTHRRRSLAALA